MIIINIFKKRLLNHEETTLVFFHNWLRYFSFVYFHVFFDKLSNKLLWHFVGLFFPVEIAFSSILRIKMIFFGRHSILCKKILN